MVLTQSFETLLDLVAAKHRQEVDIALLALAEENQELRQQITQLQDALKSDSHEAEVASVASDEQSNGREKINGENGVTSEEVFVSRRQSSKPTLASNASAWREVAAHVSVQSMDKRMDQINKKETIKLRRRLQKVLCASSGSQSLSNQVMPELLCNALAGRMESVYSLEEVTSLLVDLSQVVDRLTLDEEKEPTADGTIAISDFARLLLMENLDQYMAYDTALEVCKVRDALVAEDTDELIARLSERPSLASEDSRPIGRWFRRGFSFNHSEGQSIPENVATVLNTVVATVVVLSIILLGVSLDHDPDSDLWTWFEIVCAAVFVVECGIKVFYMGCCSYLLGPDWVFNWTDLFITVLALIDLISTVLIRSADTSIVNPLAILKVMRLLRFLRVMKLLHNSPALKQLASMLSGLWIGVPSLLWVNVLLLLLIYIVAVIFRSLFIANSGWSEYTPKELIARCGKGDFVERDNFDMPVDSACKLHLIYGEEFLGSVPRAMITIFKFITGDTSTAGGRSLTEYLDAMEEEGVSTTYVPFYFFYVPFMIIVWFGMFNIITAIFVETTITGLKHNDARNKRKRLYESRYVKRKLTDLSERIELMAANGGLGSTVDAADLHLDQQCFVQLMSDSEVKSLLLDLDVIMDETTCMFEMFDPDGTGMITTAEFLATVLRLRGEPQKIDLVSSWSSLRMLQKSFQDFQQVVVASLRQVASDQQFLAFNLESLKTEVMEEVIESGEGERRGSKERKPSKPDLQSSGPFKERKGSKSDVQSSGGSKEWKGSKSDTQSSSRRQSKKREDATPALLPAIHLSWPKLSL